MKIAILHNAVRDTASPDERDVLVQVSAISTGLEAGGHEIVTAAVDLDLTATRHLLLRHQPDVVFNLVETLAGDTRLAAFIPALLESLGLPYTGASSETLLLTADKVVTKARLLEWNVPTPRWWHSPNDVPPAHARVIVKPLREDASVGVDDNAVLRVESGETVEHLLRRAHARLPSFVEQYVEGREVNVAVMSSPSGPWVLPAAEIMFIGYPPGKPRIVGYRAKWDESSTEYQNTQRGFLGPEDAVLAGRLEDVCRDIWRRLDLTGYARVDFRVTPDGQPLVLEVNANPCLSPDAGFAAAARAAGMSYEQMVQSIVAEGCRHHEVSRSPH